jgi:hypothetical protein
VAQITLFELGAANGRRYSQFSWRTRMALAHKGLDFETVPVRVSDKAAIAFSRAERRNGEPRDRTECRIHAERQRRDKKDRDCEPECRLWKFHGDPQ